MEEKSWEEKKIKTGKKSPLKHSATPHDKLEYFFLKAQYIFQFARQVLKQEWTGVKEQPPDCHVLSLPSDF